MKGIFFLYTLIISLLVFVHPYRLEPMILHKTRQKYYKENFNSSKLTFAYDEDKGYYCVAKQDIMAGDQVLDLNRNATLSTFDDFPLKDRLHNTIISNEIIKDKFLNVTSNLLLTTRLLFELKANMTEVFLSMRKYNSDEHGQNLDNFRSYLKRRNSNEYLFNFLKNLPLASSLSQMSWSDEDISDYKLTGFLPVFKKTLVQIYESLQEDFKNDKFLNDVTKSWFNKKNLNYFISLYDYTMSRSFRLTIEEVNDEDKTDENLTVNKHGGSMLLPFLELCNHYHPKLENKNDTRAKLKVVKLKHTKERVIVKAMNAYKEDEEFSFSYSSLLSNDYLLLNYGFIIKNNPFQEFVFRLDLDDPGFKFYSFLKKKGFDTDLISFVDEDKLALHFPLLYNKENENLFSFIQIYNSYFVDDRQSKKNQAPIGSKTYQSLRNIQLYLSTIETNLKEMINTMEDKRIDYLYDSVKRYENLVVSLNKQIQSVKEEEDVRNFDKFKKLHDALKKRLIWNFNLENVKILFSHINMMQNKRISILHNNIVKLKKYYVN